MYIKGKKKEKAKTVASRAVFLNTFLVTACYPPREEHHLRLGFSLILPQVLAKNIVGGAPHFFRWEDAAACRRAQELINTLGSKSSQGKSFRYQRKNLYLAVVSRVSHYVYHITWITKKLMNKLTNKI